MEGRLIEGSAGPGSRERTRGVRPTLASLCLARPNSTLYCYSGVPAGMARSRVHWSFWHRDRRLCALTQRSPGNHAQLAAAAVITEPICEKMVLMLAATEGMMAPAATATNPAIRAYSIRS